MGAETMKMRGLIKSRAGFSLFIFLCMLILIGLSPVSAIPDNTALQLNEGDTVFLGETDVVVNAPLFGSEVVYYINPDTEEGMVGPVVVDTNFDNNSHNEFNTSTLGTWFYWDPVAGKGDAAFYLANPTMSILVRDVVLCDNRLHDRTGMQVMNSQDLEFVTGIDEKIFARGVPGAIKYDIVLTDGVNPQITPNGMDLSNVNMAMNPDPSNPDWNTGYVKPNGQYDTPPGIYTFNAVCQINGLLVSSSVKSVTLIEPTVGITVTPGTVQRGNPATVSITGEPNTDYYFGIIECPLRMTGEACDRPPWIGEIINGTFIDDINDPHHMDGEEPLVPNCCGGSPFSSVIPEIIPADGHARYIGITTDCNGSASFFIESDTLTWKKIEPAEYTLHVQKAEPEIDGTTLYSQTILTITKGDVTIQFYDAADPTETAITEAFLGDRIGIKGTNTESAVTYLYMTGPCQPECGGGLFPVPYPYGLIGKGPELVNVVGGSWVLVNPYTVDPETWWDTSKLPINPGTYTIYALSAWPSGCPNPGGYDQRCPDVVTCGGGTCELLNCPNCLVYAVGTITLKAPELEANATDIERCCCPGYPCGTTIDGQPIYISGVSTGNTPYQDIITGETTKDINVWVFGKGKIGDKKFLNWHQTIPCDGAFNFTIPYVYPRGSQHPDWEIPLCTWDPGTYDVIIQTKGYNQQYDVIYEDDTLGSLINQNYIPIEQNKRWIVTTFPVNALYDYFAPDEEYINHTSYFDYAKLVQVEGPGYKLGTEVLQALIRGLDDPNIDDEFVHVQFTIKDKSCLVGTDFEADRTYGNKPLTVRFTDKSYQATSWSWDFGDGTTSTEQNPVHTYTNEGRYTVSLITNGDAKAKAVKNDYIRVAKGPTAKFTYTPDSGIKAGESEIQFTDLSSGNPTSWIWQFGDGASSPLQSPVYTYPRPGVYTVRLTVSDENGISSESATQEITVEGEPVGQVTAKFETKVQGGTKVSFIDQSSGSPTSWSWDFGDGSVSSEQFPVYTYLKEGTYNVTLSVSNEIYSDTISRVIGIR